MADDPVILNLTDSIVGADGDYGTSGDRAYYNVPGGPAGADGGNGASGDNVTVSHNAMTVTGGTENDSVTLYSYAKGGRGGGGGLGGHGGFGVGTTTGTQTDPPYPIYYTSTTSYSDGQDGGNGGSGGVSGVATATNSGNALLLGAGSDTVAITSFAFGTEGGAADYGGVQSGGTGGYAYWNQTSYFVNPTYSSTSYILAGAPGSAGLSGNGGSASDAYAEINANSIDAGADNDTLTFSFTVQGGAGGVGGLGANGAGSGAPTNGARGGNGGDGADGIARMHLNVINGGDGFDTIQITGYAVGGQGARGGDGGASGAGQTDTSSRNDTLGTSSSSTVGIFGNSGGGGNGGDAGNALVDISDNRISGGADGDTISIEATVFASAGGAGGIAGDPGTSSSYSYSDAYSSNSSSWTAGVRGLDGVAGAVGAGTIRIVGNTFDGGEGDDAIRMSLQAYGNTVIQISNNIFDGGAGSNDWLDFSNLWYVALAPQNLDINLRTNTLTIGSGVNTIRGFEFIWGSSANDTFAGDSADNTFNAWNGTDTVSFVGNRADYDVVSYDGGYTFTITHARNIGAGGGDGSDTLTSFETISFNGIAYAAAQLAANIGTNGDDTMIGTSAAENLSGLFGNDFIDGKGGADVLLGGSGNDRIVYYADAVQLDGGEGDFDTLVVNLTTANGPRPTSFNLASNNFEQAETVFTDFGGIRVTHKFYDTSWALTGSAIERLDLAGTASYSKITDTYDALGQRTTRVVNYDTGTSAGNTATTYYDLDAATPLASSVYTYTAFNQFVSQRTNNQDGSWSQYSNDVGSNTWSQLAVSYAPGNVLLSRSVYYDNGTRIFFTADHTPDNGIVSTTNTYNSGNERTKSVVVMEDSTVATTTFDIQSDGNATWDRIISTTTSTGALVSKDTYYDTGTRTLITYDTPGVTTASTTSYWNNVPFDGAPGELYRERHVNSDGSYSDTRFDIQSDGDATWERYTDFYAGGVRTKREMLNDNETSIRTVYSDDAGTTGLDAYGRAQIEAWVQTTFLSNLDGTKTLERHQFSDGTYNVYRYDWQGTDPLNEGRVDHYTAANQLLGATYF